MSGNKIAAPASAKKLKLIVDPVTRIEGHLKVEVEVSNGKVVDAKCSGGMFRGFENILVGRDPRDASQIVQRICGVCPTAHATASSMALDDAFGVEVPKNGRITRNLILGANYLQSHILHFYHLAALDYVKGPDVAPFVPRYANSDIRLDPKTNQIGVDQYLKALEIRKICHEMVALFGGRMPHVQGIVVGGTTQIPDEEGLKKYTSRFNTALEFVRDEYLPLIYTLGTVYKDLFSSGVGWKNCVSWGSMPLDDSGENLLFKRGAYIDGKDVGVDLQEIKEHVRYSWLNQSESALHYSKGETVPNVKKEGAYSFIKAPRYMGKACEVGPLARMWVTNPDLSEIGQKMLVDLYKIKATKFRDLGDLAFSTMGRHLARAEETYMTAKEIKNWLQEVKPGEETYQPSEIPDEGEGVGLTEAPRGALLHYIDIKDQKIANYQIISATIWNASPMDESDQRGPIEQSLVGVEVPDINAPVNVGRLIRSYDP